MGLLTNPALIAAMEFGGLKFIASGEGGLKISFGSFSFAVNNPLVLAGIAIIALFFLFRWGIKKFLIFNFILAGSIYLMVKADTFIINFFGKEEGEFFTLLTKPLFVFIVGFVFIYYTFIDRE